MCNHCMHPTGSGSTWGWGGKEDGRCCHCGAYGQRQWSEVERPVPDHGFYFMTVERAYEPWEFRGSYRAMPTNET